MQVKQSQTGFGFWLWWVIASTIGWVVGFIAGFASGSGIVEDVFGNNALGFTFAYFMFGALLGSVVSFMQWLVFRRHVSRAGWWIVAGTAGFAVAGGGGYGAAVVAFGLSEALESPAALMGWSAVAAFGGAMTGIMQWIILRTQVARAGSWVLASAAGWGLGMTAGLIGIVLEAGTLLELLSLACGGVVLGAVTGGALTRLLQKPAPQV
ncbi:hypothetical protein JW906_15495 [bacterium]|nr:hypothetical protein [bacterium]